MCGETVKKGEVIPALGHKTQLVGAKAATCTEDGYTGDEVCTVCGETDPNYKPAVKTGDDSNTTLWVMLLTVSALLAAAVVVLPRKKHTR